MLLNPDRHATQNSFAQLMAYVFDRLSTYECCLSSPACGYSSVPSGGWIQFDAAASAPPFQLARHLFAMLKGEAEPESSPLRVPLREYFSPSFLEVSNNLQKLSYIRWEFLVKYRSLRWASTAFLWTRIWIYCRSTAHLINNEREWWRNAPLSHNNSSFWSQRSTSFCGAFPDYSKLRCPKLFSTKEGVITKFGNWDSSSFCIVYVTLYCRIYCASGAAPLWHCHLVHTNRSLPK